MAFWSKWFEKKTSTLASPAPWMYDLFGSATSIAGEIVSPYGALKCTAVSCAVRAISEAAGQLPVHLYSKDASGAKSRAVDHPLYSILHCAVNDFTAASEFQEQMVRDALLFGNSYAFVNRVGGKVVELTRLRPEACNVIEDLITGEPVYQITLPGTNKYEEHGFKDIFHLKAPVGLIPHRGESIVMEAREAIGLALALEAHAARIFANGGRPSGVLAFPGKLTADVVTRIRTAWNAAHNGSNSGGTAVLEEGGSFQPLGFSSVDNQFLQLREFSINEIARAFRVAPLLLQELARGSTWRNSEEIAQQFISFTLLPWLTRYVAEVHLKLLDSTERETLYAEFDLNHFLKADFQARAQAYQLMIQSRILNPNECRELENLPPYAGGEKFINPNTTPMADPNDSDAAQESSEPASAVESQEPSK